MPHHPLRTRSDISENLIHFVRKPTGEEAFSILERIVSERRLLGGTGYIKGGHRCVCFTEAPLDSIAEVIWRSQEADLKYQPFGICVTKTWLYSRGGRPAIYGPDSDYYILPPDFQHRHVRYEPTAQQPIDLTWEREWRIKIDELPLDPAHCSVVVLEAEHDRRLRAAFDAEEDARIQQYALMVGSLQAALYRQQLPWTVHVLDSISPEDIVQHYADRGYLNR